MPGRARNDQSIDLAGLDLLQRIDDEAMVITHLKFRVGQHRVAG
jgi:hypothetical protein